ncbi:hypothetical protein CPAV1605_831 [seawater metagenome]|uniref:Uncharacterized protein n=1 Tax=seawater metagenome TaxID=1561972 RepID=A0A5E8CJ06_9ZZZZ
MSIKEDKTVYYPRTFITQLDKNVEVEKKNTDVISKEKLIEKQLNIIERNEALDKITKRKKTVFINIDSSVRNKIPKNIIENEYNTLGSNPISLYKDSNEVWIKDENIINIDDDVVIINVDTPISILNKRLTFINGSFFVVVNHPNHQITEDYKKNHEFFDIDMQIYNQELNSIGNIPINFLNSIHDIILYKNEDQFNIGGEYFVNRDPVVKYIQKNNLELDININKFKENNYLIKLPIAFSSSNSISNQSYIYPENVGIKFMNIGGIPLNMINSNFPLSPDNLEGNQTITKKRNNSYCFYANVKAYKSVSDTGGNKVIVSKITSTIPGFPFSNNYSIRANRPLYNVSSIEIIGSEFPNTISVINSSNNKLYWKNIEDGNYVYNLEIPIGNYDKKTLSKIIEDKFNEIPRINSTQDSKFYHNLTVSIDPNTDKTILNSRKKIILKSPFSFRKININDEDRIEVGIKGLKNEILNPGDEIIINNAESVFKIPNFIINQSHRISKIDANVIYIILPAFNEINYDNNNKGGQAVNINIPFLIQLIFDKPNTIGGVLGFNEAGLNYAKTNYRSIITNLEEDFVNKHSIMEQEDNVINLSGKFNYFFLNLNNYENILTNTTQTPVFAKIQLSGNPNDILFNTYTEAPKIFDPPLTQITQFDIICINPLGEFMKFNNVNHSFTLKIIEEISNPAKELVMNNQEKITELSHIIA